MVNFTIRKRLETELLDRGYTFDSYSDTEVLLTSYIEFGKDCVDHINGIFAFGIWDELIKSYFYVETHLV